MAKKDRRSGSKKIEDRAKKDATKKLATKEYEAELARLQGELVKLQYWVKEKGQRVIVVFAAETQNLLSEARRKLEAKGLDMIVANDVSVSGFSVL